MSRIVVIGAGGGGLAAAARLAAAGHEVAVYEQAATVGGKLGRYERDGYLFDTRIPGNGNMGHPFGVPLTERWEMAALGLERAW